MAKKEFPAIPDEKRLEQLCKNSVRLVEYMRSVAVSQIDYVQIITYFILGKWIVEEQQNGQDRAAYGKKIINCLSERMSAEFDHGFSRSTLQNIRQFYRTYKDRIPQPVVSETDFQKRQPVVGILNEKPAFALSWTHYLILMRIKNKEERDFYEAEAISQHWGKRELQRQYSSSLYERLLLSGDKKNVMKMAKRGHVIETVQDIVKDPYVLEFVGLQDKPSYSESDLEARLIDHLQDFLMEMGKGYTFVGRQVRFSFEEDHFRVDLVLYNRLMRCFVLVDLKTEKLKHQDLGQMQMYVNYYDRFEKTEDENPTVGILLCSDKNDAMVKLTLPENSNIYAAKYELYLPDKKLLKQKLKEWINEAEKDG